MDDASDPVGEGGEGESVGADTTLAAEAGEGDRGGAPAPSPASPNKPNWEARQVAKARQQVADLRRQIAELQATTTTKVAPAGGETPAPDISAQVRAQAAQLVEQQKFVDQCVAVHAKGVELFGQEFDDGVKKLSGLVDMSDPKEAATYNQFLATALKTGQAEVLLNTLAKDPEQAERIMAMGPVDQAMEMMKMATGTAKPTVSKAAAPVRATGGRANPAAAVSPDDKERAETLTTAEWMAKRNAQVAELRKNGRRIQ